MSEIAALIAREERTARTNVIVEERAGFRYLQQALVTTQPRPPKGRAASITDEESEEEEEVDEEVDIGSAPKANHDDVSPSLDLVPEALRNNEDFRMYLAQQHITERQKEWETFERKSRELRRIAEEMSSQQPKELQDQLDKLVNPIKKGKSTKRPPRHEEALVSKAETTANNANAEVNADSSSLFPMLERAKRTVSTPPDPNMPQHVGFMGLETREAAARRRRLQQQQQKQQQQQSIVDEDAHRDALMGSLWPSERRASQIGRNGTAAVLPPLKNQPFPLNNNDAGSSTLPSSGSALPLTTNRLPSLAPLSAAAFDSRKKAINAEVQTAAVKAPNDQQVSELPPLRPSSRAAALQPGKLDEPLQRSNGFLIEAWFKTLSDSEANARTSIKSDEEVAWSERQYHYFQFLFLNAVHNQRALIVREEENVGNALHSKLTVDQETASRQQMHAVEKLAFQYIELVKEQRTLQLSECIARQWKELQQDSEHRHLQNVASTSLQELAGRNAIANVAQSMWTTFLTAEVSERQLCDRLSEERRVREEAERRVRSYTERRAREERERAVAEILRRHVEEQTKLLGKESETRRALQQAESSLISELGRQLSELLNHIRTSKETSELARRENEDRRRREDQLALEQQHHDARKSLQDFALDERSLIAQTEDLEFEALERSERHDRRQCESNMFQRQRLAVEQQESHHRATVISTESESWHDIQQQASRSFARACEAVKHREAIEAKTALAEAEKLLQEALEVKRSAAEKLREETKRFEEERQSRAIQEHQMRCHSAQSMLINQESMHRQVTEMAADAERESICARQQSQLETLQSRLVEQQRRVEVEEQLRREHVARQHAELTRRMVGELSHREDMERRLLQEREEEDRMLMQRTERHEQFHELERASAAEAEAEQQRRAEEEAAWRRSLDASHRALLLQVERDETDGRSRLEKVYNGVTAQLTTRLAQNRSAVLDHQRLHRQRQLMEHTDASLLSQSQQLHDEDFGETVLREVVQQETFGRSMLVSSEADARRSILELHFDALATGKRQKIMQAQSRVAQHDPALLARLEELQRAAESQRQTELQEKKRKLETLEQENRSVLASAEERNRLELWSASVSEEQMVRQFVEQRAQLLRLEEETNRLEEQRRLRAAEELRQKLEAQKRTIQQEEYMYRQVIEASAESHQDSLMSKATVLASLITTRETASRLAAYEEERRREEAAAHQRAVIAARTEMLLIQLVQQEGDARTKLVQSEDDGRDGIEVTMQQDAQSVFHAMAAKQAEVQLDIQSDFPNEWNSVVQEREEALRRAVWEGFNGRPPTVEPTLPPVKPLAPADIRSMMAQSEWMLLQRFIAEETFLRSELSLSEAVIRCDWSVERRQCSVPMFQREGVVSKRKAELHAVEEEEGFLRAWLVSLEQKACLALVLAMSENDSVGNPELDKQLSRFRSTEKADEFCAAEQEVLFQREYFARERMISSYNRIRLRDMMLPVATDTALMHLVAAEHIGRRRLESNEATITTKFWKRYRRHLRWIESIQQQWANAKIECYEDVTALVQLPEEISRGQPTVDSLGAMESAAAVRSQPSGELVEGKDLLLSRPLSRLSSSPHRARGHPASLEASTRESWLSESPRLPVVLKSSLFPLRDEIEQRQLHARELFEGQGLRQLEGILRHIRRLQELATQYDAERTQRESFFQRSVETVESEEYYSKKAQWALVLQAEREGLLRTEQGRREATKKLEHFLADWTLRSETLLRQSLTMMSKYFRTVQVFYDDVVVVEQRVIFQDQLRQRTTTNMQRLCDQELLERKVLLNDEAEEWSEQANDFGRLVSFMNSFERDLVQNRSGSLAATESKQREFTQFLSDQFFLICTRSLHHVLSMESQYEAASNSKRRWAMEECVALMTDLNNLKHRSIVLMEQARAALSREEETMRGELQAEVSAFSRLAFRCARWLVQLNVFEIKCSAAKVLQVEFLAGNNALTYDVPAVATTVPSIGADASMRRAVRAVQFLSSARRESSAKLGEASVSPGEETISESLANRLQTFQSFRRPSSLAVSPTVELTRSPSTISTPQGGSSRNLQQRQHSVVFDSLTPPAPLDDLPPLVAQMVTLLQRNDPALTEVRLSVPMTVEQLQAVAVAAQGNPYLTRVDATGATWLRQDKAFLSPLICLANAAGKVKLANCEFDDNFVTTMNEYLCRAPSSTGDGNNSSSALRSGNIAEIDLSNNKLTNRCVASFTHVAMSSHSILTKVNLSGTAVDEMNRKWLQFYLDLNTQLPPFKKALIAVERQQEIPKLTFSIPRNASSSAANLQGHDALFRREFDDRSVRLVCIACALNPHVQSISFRGNRVTDKGATLLALLLRKQSTLLEIDLSYNEIGDDGLKELEAAVAVNDHVLYVNVSQNNKITNSLLLHKMNAKLNKNIATRGGE